MAQRLAAREGWCAGSCRNYRQAGACGFKLFQRKHQIFWWQRGKQWQRCRQAVSIWGGFAHSGQFAVRIHSRLAPRAVAEVHMTVLSCAAAKIPMDAFFYWQAAARGACLLQCRAFLTACSESGTISGVRRRWPARTRFGWRRWRQRGRRRIEFSVTFHGICDSDRYGASLTRAGDRSRRRCSHGRASGRRQHHAVHHALSARRDGRPR